MSLFRYTAVTLGGPSPGERQSGEITGDSGAAVRAALRRAGLQVLELRPVDERASSGSPWSARFGWWRAHLRGRRRLVRSELYDGLATMLTSGVPLLEALETARRAVPRSRLPLIAMLSQLREAVRSGSSLDEALEAHPTWFELDEIAVIRAGAHGGNLAEVLRELADRHERSGELAQRLATALAYPAIVGAVGLGVWLFLSVKTLPELVGVLADADLEPPPLTAAVMAAGGAVASHWPLALLAPLALFAGLLALRRLADDPSRRGTAWLRRLSPRVLRKIAVANVTTRLADLIHHGVPMVEALRVVAPTSRSPALRRRLTEASDRVEQGEELAAALDDDHWFDPEYRHLLRIAQVSGELDALLARIGRRYERQARRLIDRLASLLEPAVILGLAVLIGVVVMAAVLPIVRLQEVL